MDNKDYKSLDEVNKKDTSGETEKMNTVPQAKTDSSSGSAEHGGEHHHHQHHHHHHHHSENSSSSSRSSSSKKPKKWYRDPKKRTKYITIGSIALVLILAICIFAVVRNSKIDKSGSNYFTYSIVENEVSFNGNKVNNIYIKYGEWDVEITEATADYSLKLSDSLAILYNGTYTGTVVYKDESKENFTFRYNELAQPIALSESDGMINISVNKNYRVNFLYYVYGQTLGDPYARYIPLDAETTSVQALGNGIHTFRINATSSIGDVGTTTYYVAYDVKTCTKPVILLTDTSVGLFAYGFNVRSVAYTKGQYSSWNEIKDLDTLYYSMCNTNLDRTDFESGVYTFCFKTDTQDYILNIEL